MQKQTSLYIPKPCHEDWNKMSPTQQGKFCGNCNKHVIDFSLMSDNQVLNFLSQQSGKLCGRFDAEQLQRPLIETKIKKKKSWWMALTMPLLFLFDRSEAQESIPIKPDTITQVYERKDLIVGKLIYTPLKQVTVTGKVVDENNNPLAFSSIIQKGTTHETVADSLGNFTLTINSNDDSAILVASYIGFVSKEKQIQKLRNNDTVNIIIKIPEYVTSGLVSVVAIAGGITAYHPVTTIDTIKAVVKKICNNSAFKIYPNPAMKGNEIQLEIKQPGEYELQLLDNQSRLIMAEEVNATTEKSITPVSIPSSITAGIYYLRLINEQTKKSYTEKLIIQ